jgi:hypothetical protein
MNEERQMFVEIADVAEDTGYLRALLEIVTVLEANHMYDAARVVLDLGKDKYREK